MERTVGDGARKRQESDVRQHLADGLDRPGQTVVAAADGSGRHALPERRLSEELTVADVKCYFCGHVSGQVVSLPDGGAPLRSLLPATGGLQRLTPASRLRCERCRGPVYLEEVSLFDLPEGLLDRLRRLREGRRGAEGARQAPPPAA